MNKITTQFLNYLICTLFCSPISPTNIILEVDVSTNRINISTYQRCECTICQSGHVNCVVGKHINCYKQLFHPNCLHKGLGGNQ